MSIKKKLTVLFTILATLPAILSAQENTKLYINDFQMDGGSIQEVAIILENPDFEVWQAQFDLRLSEGLTIVEDEGDLDFTLVRNDSKNYHILDAAYIADEGVTRVLIYTSKERTIAGTEGTFVTFRLKAADDFNFGTIKLENIKLAPIEGTSIKPAESQASVIGTTGIKNATRNDNLQGKVFKPDGVKVLDNATDMNSLEKGVYVTNGKKIAVK